MATFISLLGWTDQGERSAPNPSADYTPVIGPDLQGG